MKGRQISYEPEELAWVEERRHWARADLHRAFCVFWRRADVSQPNLTALCKRNGWLTGRTGRIEKGAVAHNKGKPMSAATRAKVAGTMFQKGQMAGRARALHKPIGAERLTKDGYLQRKVNDDLPAQARWRLVQIIRWEEINGPLQRGMALKCLDGDRLNTEPSNWEAIPRSMLPRLNNRHGRNYDGAPAEIKPTLMLIAKVEQAVSEARHG